MAKRTSSTERKRVSASADSSPGNICRRVEKLAEAAHTWASAAEQAPAWDVRRCARLAQEAATVVVREVTQGRKDLGVSDWALVQGLVASAQEAARVAARAAEQAPKCSYHPSVVEQIREAKRQAWTAWLTYSNNGQPEAELLLANLRLAHDLIAEHLLVAERASVETTVA